MSVLMEEMYLEKLKFHKWYIPNVAKAFEIGKLLSSKASETKDTWVHDCRDKRSGKTVIMKIIKRSMRKNLLQDLCTQLFELQQLYDKLENKFNLGTIKCFDCELEKDGEVNKIVVRLVMDKYNGTLRSLIQSGQRIKPQEYIEQVKYFSLMMFELEGRNTSHKNLSINSIYYTFDSSSRIVWKLFGFASLLWDAAEGSLMYASPEEKFSLSRFETSLSSSAYDLDYFKVDTYNLGIVLIELLVMKEMGKWGFQLDGGMGDDPKRKDEYTNQVQLNDMIASNAEYLRLHGFLLGLLKTMVHVNPRKRDRFARVVSVLHEGLKLKLLAYQLDPIGKDDHFESVSSEVVEKQQNELKQKDEELAKLVKKNVKNK